jgi:hypothetical protein
MNYLKLDVDSNIKNRILELMCLKKKFNFKFRLKNKNFQFYYFKFS